MIIDHFGQQPTNNSSTPTNKKIGWVLATPAVWKPAPIKGAGAPITTRYQLAPPSIAPTGAYHGERHAIEKCNQKRKIYGKKLSSTIIVWDMKFHLSSRASIRNRATPPKGVTPSHLGQFTKADQYLSLKGLITQMGPRSHPKRVTTHCAWATD